MPRWETAVFSIVVALLCGGCAPWSDTPRSRVGALPFHGVFTLYSTADPERLGRHRYGQVPRFFQADEKERGIIYTCRGGFLDLAHIRLTIDRTRYCAVEVRKALRSGTTSLTLEGPNGSVFHVKLNYPPGWDALDRSAQCDLGDELSVVSGQRLAYLMMAWHEVITWFGHRGFFLVDESPSAFTWDDTMAHVIGIRVAGRALRDTTREFDDAVTAALADEMRQLGAVSPSETNRAVRAVEGVWWSSGRPLKRQFNIGLRDRAVSPWLIPNFAGCDPAGPAEGEPFDLPRLSDVLGEDAPRFYSVEIDPRICQASKMRAILPGRPRRFDEQRDLPVLMQVIRDQMREQFGTEVNNPRPEKPDPAASPKPQKDASARQADTSDRAQSGQSARK